MKNLKKLSRAEMRRVEGGVGCKQCLSVNCEVGGPCNAPGTGSPGTCTQFVCDVQPGCVTYFNKCL